MSLQFSDTTNLNGIIQSIEVEIYGIDSIGTITGNPTLMKLWTARVNQAWDKYIRIAIRNSGGRQFDDSNHTDYATIETDLVAGERSVTFTEDERGNLILEVFKTMVRNSDGVYQEVNPIDQQAQGQGMSIWDGQDITGTPTEYDKTGNGILFNYLPDYNWRIDTEGKYGVKMFINREASYFTTDDAEKKPGCMGTHHRYFVVEPCYRHAAANSLANASALKDELIDFEGNEETGIMGSIARDYATRNKDERPRMTHKKINYI